MDHGTLAVVGCTGSRERRCGECDLCSHTGFLVAAAAALASRARLWGPRWSPRLVPVSGVRLGGALNSLSSCTRKQRDKKKSLASSAAPDLFLDSLPASCGALAPSGCVHAANTSPLPGVWPPKLEPQLPAPPAPAGEQTSLSGWWVLVGTDPLCGHLSALPSAPLWLRSPPWLRSFSPPPLVSTREEAS